MAIFVVNTLQDQFNGVAGGTSLREAVQLAAATPGADRILFADGLSGSSTLTFGQIVIVAGNDLTIDGDTNGDDAADVTLVGNGTDRIFTVAANDVTFSSLDMTRGTTTENGGAVLHTGSTLTIEDSVLSNNSAVGMGASGGAIAASGDLLVLDGVRLAGNVATRAGGAVEVTDGADVDILDSTLTGNATGGAPGNGGALHVTGGGSFVTLNLSRITANSAAAEGGGLWNDAGSTMSVSNTIVRGNVAFGDDADQGGGGVYNNGGTLNLTDSTVADNAAVGVSGSGGGILSVDGTVTIDGTTLSGNAAARAGGALEVIDGAVRIGNSSLLNNVAGDSANTLANPGNGGAVHVSGMDGTTVGIADTLVSGNVATAEGGGLWNQAGSAMTVSSSRIFNNVASGDDASNGGGGLFNNGGALSVFNTRIAGNVADGAAGSGGGLLSVDGTVRVTDSFLGSNVSSRAGGGIEVIDGVLNVAGSRFVANQTGGAPGNGGGIHVTGAASTAVNDGVFVRNAASAEGGALWNSSTGTMIVTDTTVRFNAAFGDDATNGGGGLFNDGGTLTVVNSTIEGNGALGASGSGGGIFSGGGRLTVRDTALEDNAANRAGGGVEITGGTLSSTGNSYSGNMAGDAPGNGGAIHASGMGTSVAVRGDLFASNDAANQGGGLWVGDGVAATVTGSIFVGNTADGMGGGGALYAQADGDLTVNGTLFAANEAPRGEVLSVQPGPGTGDVFLGGGSRFTDGTVVLGDSADRVVGDGFANTIDGNGGNDTLFGRAGDDVLTGGFGADRLSGQNGNDRLFGQAGNDVLGGGADDDRMFGGFGDDRLFGGTGDDLLVGSAGRDVLTGGAGIDVFGFGDGDSLVGRADIITDFGVQDRINLRLVDANELVAGDQSFTFIGNAAFSGAAGELRTESGGGLTRIDGDTDGDGLADFRVVLGNGAVVMADDLVL